MDNDLKALERRAFRATFQDGLWDIYLGLVFVAFGLVPALRHGFDLSEGGAMVIHIGLLLVAMVILIAGKRLVTVPRLGYVRFGEGRQRKLLKVRVILAASVVGGLVALALITGDSVGLTGLMVIFAINLLVVLGAMAYFMDYDRLFAYAILWSLSLPVGVILEDNTALRDAPTVFIVTGGVAVVIGALFFQRFLHEYRLPPAEASR